MRGLRALAPSGTIETVLDAVLDNAVKFTPRGGVITVSTTDVAGIPPDELGRAADRFWRSPTQSNVEGFGLGLAIAARTIEVSGGALLLELPLGGGLRVAARLPGYRPEPTWTADPPRSLNLPTWSR